MFEGHAAKVRCLAAGAALLALAGCLGSGGEEAPATEAGTGIGAVMRVADTTRARGDLATAAGLYRRAHELEPDAAPVNTTAPPVTPDAAPAKDPPRKDPPRKDPPRKDPPTESGETPPKVKFLED